MIIRRANKQRLLEEMRYDAYIVNLIMIKVYKYSPPKISTSHVHFYQLFTTVHLSAFETSACCQQL